MRRVLATFASAALVAAGVSALLVLLWARAFWRGT